MPKSRIRIKQLLIVIATTGVIFVNYLAGTGRINNTTPAEISDRYPTAITAAGYAFSIWSLIYFGLIAFSIYQALPSQAANPRFSKIRTLYVGNCAANCAWIYLWHHDLIAASLAMMFVILLTLVLINVNLRETKSAAETWTTRVPFNIYFGWITVAAILNASIALIYFGVRTPAAMTTFLACALIAVAVILALIIRRNFDFPSYALTVAWALIAIAVKQSADAAIMTAAIAGAIIAILTAFFGRKKIN